MIESIHAVTYFAPQCRRTLRQAGLKGFWAGYFAARAAPLGAVGAGPVAAAFFNFDPAMVRRAVPSCWAVVDPASLTVRRAAAAAAALHELCAPTRAVRWSVALPTLRRAAARCAGEGRPMTGANRELWPSVEAGLRRHGLPEPIVELGEAWQACTTLREHRGDGHVAALLTQGLRRAGGPPARRRGARRAGRRPAGRPGVDPGAVGGGHRPAGRAGTAATRTGSRRRPVRTCIA